MRGLHGVSTVHESEPLMHQAISAVPCLWGFAWKWVLFKMHPPNTPTPTHTHTHLPTPRWFPPPPFLIWNCDFNNEQRFFFYPPLWRNVGLDKVGHYWQTFFFVLFFWTYCEESSQMRAFQLPARHICMAAVAENGITKSVTNLIRSLISNKLA